MTAPTIPRIIHQVWIGPHDPPAGWMGTWPQAHPGWGYRLWREADIDALGLTHRRLYDRYIADRRWCGAVNIARVEILLRHGGVYIDADTACLRPLDNAPFMVEGMWLPYTPNTNNGRVSNAVIGAVPAHPTMAAYQQALSHVTTLHPSWQTTGGLLMTDVIRRHPKDVCLLPAATFLPVRSDGRPAPGRNNVTVYGIHHWGTTKGHYK